MSGATALPFAEVRSWLFEHAWPFWSRCGIDDVSGGFVEVLDLSGRDGGADFKRVRAQARQIYCFSQAALLGFAEGGQASDHGWEFLRANGRRPDGGWGRRMGRRGGLLDPTSDAYDYAFVLFALAWRHRLTGDPALLRMAEETLDVLDVDLGTKDGVGWLSEPAAGRLQQNPHMHMLEAAIELADATGSERFHDLGRTLVLLFKQRLLDRSCGALREHYGPGWAWLDTYAGRVVEPGHQFEWVWLLFRAEAVLGISAREEADLLYASACRHGVDPRSGLVYDQVDVAGVAQVKDSRVWPQTEALKAHLAMMERRGIDARSEIMRVITNLRSSFLAVEPLGTWTDHRRFDGRIRSDAVPSTTLYHLQLAWTELLRLQPLLEAADQGDLTIRAA